MASKLLTLCEFFLLPEKLTLPFQKAIINHLVLVSSLTADWFKLPYELTADKFNVKVLRSAWLVGYQMGKLVQIYCRSDHNGHNGHR